jgi:hypothetical protein
VLFEMTTIAFRDGVMAADSRCVDANMGIHKATKLFQVQVGRQSHLLGGCGCPEAIGLFVDWYGSRDTGVFQRLTSLHSEADFTVLIWTGRKLSWVDRIMRITELDEPYAAIGSGAAHAITAMDCGKNAVTAVRMAAKRDSSTGGRVVSLKL